MTSFEGVRIKTPVLKASDGCLSRNFSTVRTRPIFVKSAIMTIYNYLRPVLYECVFQERCLGRIYSVLMWYKEHMNYIERENLTQPLTNDVKHGTKRFLESIYSQVNTL